MGNGNYFHFFGSLWGNCVEQVAPGAETALSRVEPRDQ